jgi:hypothetical protein
MIKHIETPTNKSPVALLFPHSRLTVLAAWLSFRRDWVDGCCQAGFIASRFRARK